MWWLPEGMPGMKRRSYIVLAGGALTGGVAAAATTNTSLNDAPVPAPMRRITGPNQWGRNPVTVTTVSDSGASIPAGYDDRFTAALTYWETNSDIYTGQTVSFDRIEPTDPATADIIVTITNVLKSCGDKETEYSFAGCAPRPSGRLPMPAYIEIRASNRGAYLQEVLKHELGHVLGLAHSDPPQSVMSTEMADRLTDYPERRTALHSYSDGIGALNTAYTQYEDAKAAVKTGDYDTAVTPVTDAIDHFQIGSEEFTAAGDLVSEIDDVEADRLRPAIHEAQRAAITYKTATTHLHDAITAALDNEITEKDAHLRKHTTFHDMAESIDIADAKTIAHYLHVPVS